MTNAVLYVYGFVRDAFDATRSPAGLDDAPVAVVRAGRVAALASQLAADQYTPELVEQRSGEVSWLSPRAMAHDRILTWAQDHGGVLPLPMFALWRTEEALARSLAEREPELLRTFEHVADADEFGLRVHRRDADLLQAIDELDPDIARLRRDALAASPGQRYLLERKIAEQAKGAVRAAGQRMARQIFEALSGIARAAVARPLTPDPGRTTEATLVLNGAFLVDRKRLDEFRAAVAAFVRDLQPRGLAFDFTGPWPPYNFVGAASEHAAAS